MLSDSLTQMERSNSLFERSLRNLKVPICSIFKDGSSVLPVSFEESEEEMAKGRDQKITDAFPKTAAENHNRILRASGPLNAPPTGKRVAVLFSGGPASGGHNVVAGLKRVLGKENTLLGVRAGPKGLIAGDLFEISEEDVERIVNTGGFDFLGSDRTKIKTDEQFEEVKETCLSNRLDGVVIVGGDDSNTNAAVLAEYLYDQEVKVIGVPKTIDGDLQAGSHLPITFGYDTATKIYSELAGNILQDTPSSRKYWHFIKVMGRSASHVALEVGLQTKPAVCLISEEVAVKGIRLPEIVESIAQKVVRRARKGINHGCVIVPEGLIEAVPGIQELIVELNELLADEGDVVASFGMEQKRDFVAGHLAAENAKLFASFPHYIEEMLLLDRDSHGNLQVSQIPTERLLIDMVTSKVRELDGSVNFQTQSHFFGYEGRCGAPTLFDATYTYHLGLIAGSLILADRTGYICAMTDFDSGGRILALPLTGLLTLERRHGEDELVIEKALVEVDSPAFRYFDSRRESWADEDCFASPGPRQLWGPTANQVPITVALNQGYDSLEFRI